MRIDRSGCFILVFFLALLVFSAVGQAPLYAESNGSGGTPFPEDSVPPAGASSTSATQSGGLSAAELLYLYLLIL